MVWRRANEAVGDQIIEREGQSASLKRNLNTSGGGRLSLREHQRAHRHRAFLATVIILLFMLAARHVVGHRGHTGRLTSRQLHRHNWGCQWRRDKPCDHEDRQQATDESIKTHGRNIALNRYFWKVRHFTNPPIEFSAGKTF